jgi:hypothetical protein
MLTLTTAFKNGARIVRVNTRASAASGPREGRSGSNPFQARRRNPGVRRRVRRLPRRNGRFVVRVSEASNFRERLSHSPVHIGAEE